MTTLLARGTGVGAVLTALLAGAIAHQCAAQETAGQGIALDILKSACLDHLPDFSGTATTLLATGDYYATGNGNALRHSASGLTVEVVVFYDEPACLVGTFSKEDARSFAFALQDLPPVGQHRHLARFIADHPTLQGFGVIVVDVPEGEIIR